MLKTDFFDKTFKQLNIQQKAAVKFGDGPLLIVAGAGTGKTTVITHRLAWLIYNKKAEPDQILALTFTDKAAGEMEERVDQLLPYGYVDLWVSTFHSFGERVLKDHALDLGLSPGFKILSAPEQWFLVRQNFERFKLKYYRPLGNPNRFIYALVKHFSRLKDEHIEPDAYLRYASERIAKDAAKTPEEKEEAEKILEVAQAYEVYQKLLHENGWLDFGDLILYALKLLQTRKTILEKYRRQFKYILVDEFQDTNYAQYELVKLLAAPRNNLTVCGDDDQSIFKFRGASISNILKFKKDFPKATNIVLTENYRNKQGVLDLAYDFIQLNNPNRLEAQLSRGRTPITKKLRSHRPGKQIIEHIHAETQEREVMAVLKKIVELKEKKNSSWNDFAILVRANDMADLFITALSAQGLPFQFIASRGLFQKPEIIDLISYLKLLDNYHESSAVYRILSLPVFGIPLIELTKLLYYADQKSISLFEALPEAKIIGLPARYAQKVQKIKQLIEDHTELTRTKSVGQILYRFIKESGYIGRLTKTESLANAEKILNINKFFSRISEFESHNQDKSVKAYMAELSMMLEIGEDPSPSAIREGPEAIKILTIHSAKGLEFPYVFIVNLVDKRFPSIERREQIEVPDGLVKEIIPTGDIHLQEERRLFYVAMTRARDGLFFTTAEHYSGPQKKKPSRFLKEIKYNRFVKPVDGAKSLGLDYPEDTLNHRIEHFKYRLPTYLSFTQLKAFWICPYQYRFRFVLKVPGEPKHTFSYGKTIHNTLKDFFQLVQRNLKHDWLTLKKLYEENWIDEWYESAAHLAERKTQGLKALKAYYNLYQGKFPEVLFLEKGFVIKIDQYSIRGAIDRIDKLSDKTVEIIDYKTGKRPSSKKVEDQEQLLIYALAARESLKKEPAKLSNHYLEDGQQVGFEATDQAIQKVSDKIIRTAEQMKKSSFKATPGFHCSFCDFRDICEYRQI
ncbi:MAG: UvrD-helicase domain-containing protein [Patescibacteria group bacterium]|nr:UvrD-helicase domain-containing protein [Patescibacteria group bacterium]